MEDGDVAGVLNWIKVPALGRERVEEAEVREEGAEGAEASPRSRRERKGPLRFLLNTANSHGRRN
jgi:hypothetical protein